MYEGYGAYGGMWSEAFVPLILAFLALVFLAPIIDGIVQALQKCLEWLPVKYNDFGTVLFFAITVGVAYVICWRADFQFYAYLNVNFRTLEEAWLATALLLSGGTVGIRKRFELAQTIPAGIWGGLGSAVARMVRKDGDPK